MAEGRKEGIEGRGERREGGERGTRVCEGRRGGGRGERVPRSRRGEDAEAREYMEIEMMREREETPRLIKHQCFSSLFFLQ